MSEGPRYEIWGDDLVELVALACAHALSEGQGNDQRANELLDQAHEILKRSGVRYPSKFFEKCERALEAHLHLGEKPSTNQGSREDPYLWESGT